MKNLIRFEFRKIFRMKSFYICLVVSLLLVALTALLTKVTTSADSPSALIQGGITTSLTSSGTYLSMVCGIFIACFVCEDFNHGTIKNIYAKGYSRGNVYFAKYIVSMVGMLAYCLITILFAFLFGWIIWGRIGELPSTFFISIIGQIFCNLALNTIFYAICMLIGKTGVCIAINIMGPMILGIVLSALDLILRWESPNTSSFWLSGMINNLATTNPTTTSIIIAFVGAAIYLALFLVGGYFLTRKKEAK